MKSFWSSSMSPLLCINPGNVYCSLANVFVKNYTASEVTKELYSEKIQIIEQKIKMKILIK